MIAMDTVIHHLARRFPVKQLLGIPVEQKIYSPDMYAEMICLSKKHTVG